ncbi:MAG: hypothetical protein ACR2JV_07960 [Gaiellales bacterium]
MLIEVLAAPGAPVAGARVTVTDATGRRIAVGRTTSRGHAYVGPKKGVAPYLVRTVGGTLHGKPFSGNLELITRRRDTRSEFLFADVISTAAATYVEQRGGSYAAAERRLLKAFKLDRVLGHLHIAESSYAVDRRAVERHHRAHGGFNGTIRALVAALDGKRAFPKWSTRKVERRRGASTRQSSGGGMGSMACGLSIVPAAASTVNEQVAIYSVEMVAGLASGVFTKDPSLFMNGVAGMAFAETPGSTTASMLQSIETQLYCISQQLTEISDQIATLSVEDSLQSVKTCEGQIQTYWRTYHDLVGDASADPTDADTGYTATNANFADLMANVNAMNSSCANIINNTLFNTQGQQTAAWVQLLTNYKNGVYRQNDVPALSQQSVVELQEFLQYWGTLEYEQAALMNEYFNYKRTFGLNGPPVNLSATQQSDWASTGVPCTSAPSITDVQANQGATTWCQWQQNILDVWPGDIYTDEVANWHQSSSTGFGIGGVAISAVPVSWGTGTNASGNAPTMITPNYLHDKEIDKYDSRWNASNAVASYNARAATTIGGLNQSIFFRRAPATSTPNCSGNCGSAYPSLFKYGPFFSSWLNTTTRPATSGDDSATDLSPATSGPSWQVLAQDGTVVFTDHAGCGLNDIASDGIGTYATYTSHNTIYSPHPWTANSGGTIGGGTNANGGTDPCSVKVPIAFLKGRAWTQGASLPPAPTITTTGTVTATATLTASNCPTTGCTWSISGGTVPAGLTLSPTGTFAWTGSSPGATASVQVVAGNGSVFSAPVTLTVELT